MSNESTERGAGPVRIELNVTWPTGGESAIAECPREEWEAMTAEQRGEWCQEEVDAYAGNRVNWGYHVLGADAKDVE